ncbi:hypothetical protein MPSEU_000954500 [Mayamaea pseudoterrestris]|nr:hypothetical protein MPSEU_000954500 [Mayamaea pseudoterrestris]
MPKLALITGAASGIGHALARYHAKQGGDLVIAAEHKDGLDKTKEEIEKEFNVKVHTIPADLSKMDGAQKLYDEIKKQGLEIEYLINNAGVGGQGDVIERELQDDINMIVLNIVSYVTLTHLFAKEMAERGGGKILNVGSVAAFIPGPKQAVYHATKAFINSFSLAVNQELRGKHVSVSELCPGFVDTDIVRKAGLDGTLLVQTPPAAPETVARVGYNAMMKEKPVVISDYSLSFLVNWVIPFLPRRMLLMVLDFLHKK